jgi:hypothetical protein
MPNHAEITAFSKWITDGLLLGADPDRPDAVPSGTAYNNAVRDILRENCVSCHKADGSQLPVLTSYDKAAAAGSKALKRLEAGTMPPRSVKNEKWIKTFTLWSTKEFPLLGDGSEDPIVNPGDGTGDNDTAESDPCLATP